MICWKPPCCIPLSNPNKQSFSFQRTHSSGIRGGIQPRLVSAGRSFSRTHSISPSSSISRTLSRLFSRGPGPEESPAPRRHGEAAPFCLVVGPRFLDHGGTGHPICASPKNQSVFFFLFYFLPRGFDATSEVIPCSQRTF